MDKPLHKVTGFVTRGSGRAAELLVFRHPNAGIHLPAGTVEANEAPAAAVVREVRKETGGEAHNPALIATESTDLDGGARAAATSARLLGGPSEASGALGPTLRRGQPCRLLDVVAGFAEVSIEGVDLDKDPPKVLRRYTGWLPQQCLTTRLERNHYHLTAAGLTTRQATAASWSHWAEGRFSFECFWTVLADASDLVGPQQQWLELCRDRLTAATT